MKKVKFLDFAFYYNEYGNYITICDKVGTDIRSAYRFQDCRTTISDIVGKTLYPDMKFHLGNKNSFIGKNRHSYFAIAFINNRYKKKFLENIKTLHEKEEKAKVIKSIVFETQDPKILVVKSSKYWVSSMWLNTLFTFYLKMTIYSWKGANDSDKKYLNLLKKKEHFLLKKVKSGIKDLFGLKIFESFDWTNKIIQNDPYKIHTLTGFVSICKGDNPEMAKLIGVK